MDKKKFGFTLAEVLITLLIIGVIASIVIPGLIANTNKAEFVTKLKKEHAVLSQAFNLIKADAGGNILYDSNFSSTTNDNSEDRNAMNEFATKLNVVKNCGNSTSCWYASTLKFLGGGIHVVDLESLWNGKYGKAILADGTTMSVDINNSSCINTPNSGAAVGPLSGSVCGLTAIDVNGVSGPNQTGRDYFYFWITKTGIYPFGSFNDGYSCDINSSTTATSYGCAAKVINEGAMNY